MASSELPKFFCVRLLMLTVFCAMVKVCEGSGRIELYLNRFQGSCSDNGILDDECDTYFKFCIDRQRTPNVNRCDYVKKTTNHYHNTNSMEFGSSIKGVDNPLTSSISRFQTNGQQDVMFAMEAWDDETGIFGSDERYASISVNLSRYPAAGRDEAIWWHDYRYHSSNHIWFKYRFYCDAYYYTHKCDVYCKARDNSQGHYTCVPGTGAKKCMRGWTGTNCNQDIDECAVSVCYHNATCTNLPGTYECACPQGYAGHNCDLVDSLCHSAPCQNGGTCNGTMQSYTCDCPFQWTGDNCQTPVDFCQSSPCQNNATCYATVGNYTCDCALGWSGFHCTTEVNACDDSPCHNGATCINLPQAQYQCNCPEAYEGQNCSDLINSCDPNPCQNGGSCTNLTYNSYNCSCVYGWVGDDCGSYLNVSASTQDQDESTDVNVLPILLGILAAILIVAIILIVLFIRRRRKQKKALEAGLQNGDLHLGIGVDSVQHVANTDNLAFRNALYDRTNRANTDLEAANSNMSNGNCGGGGGGGSLVRPPMPVPADEDAFNFTKPKVLLEGEEMQGAVGGCNTNPYQDIDGYQIPGKCKEGGGDGGDMGPTRCLPYGEANLDTRTMAGAAGRNHYETVNNHYADFEDLKRRSVATREGAGYVNNPGNLERVEGTEENPYHDLDDLQLDMASSALDSLTPNPMTPNPMTPGPVTPGPVTPGPMTPARNYSVPDDFFSSDPFISNPTTPVPINADPFASDPFSDPNPVDPASHYDTPRSSQSSEITTTQGNGSAAPAFGNNLTVPITAPAGNTLGEGYMQMAGTTSREVQLDALDSSDDDEVDGAADQEDIRQLRQEALDWSTSQTQSHA